MAVGGVAELFVPLSSYLRFLVPRQDNLDLRFPFGSLVLVLITCPFNFSANEFSLFMLICSSFILNGTTEPNQFALHPYLHSFSNSRSAADLVAPILVPDILPSGIDGGDGRAGAPDFSFAAGDFLQVYGGADQAGAWDSVVTCFFVDTAR